MNSKKLINSITSLLDQGLVLLLFQLRFFPEQFNLEASFWDKIHNTASKHLIDIILDIKVIVNDENGKLIKVTARDLLPFAWEPVIVDN